MALTNKTFIPVKLCFRSMTHDWIQLKHSFLLNSCFSPHYTSRQHTKPRNSNLLSTNSKSRTNSSKSSWTPDSNGFRLNTTSSLKSRAFRTRLWTAVTRRLFRSDCSKTSMATWSSWGAELTSAGPSSTMTTSNSTTLWISRKRL